MIILDLDKTISNDAWRIQHIQWQHKDPNRRYHDYHILAGFDECRNKELFEGRDEIVIFTARPVMFRAITVEWLARNGVAWTHLLMRNGEDHSHSVDLKERQLNWLVSHYDVPLSKISHAYDDREDVVAMYKRRGVPATVRRIHNVSAYKQKEEA